jgi:hypothetical protein
VRDRNGKLFVTEAKDLKGEAATAYEAIASNLQQWFYEGDIEALSAQLPNDSSAALLLYENVWAIQFKEALLEADAELIDMGRIPPETVAEAEQLLAGGT